MRHGLSCLQYLASALPGLRFIFWCIARRTLIPNRTSSVPWEGQYSRLFSGMRSCFSWLLSSYHNSIKAKRQDIYFFSRVTEQPRYLQVASRFRQNTLDVLRYSDRDTFTRRHMKDRVCRRSTLTSYATLSVCVTVKKTQTSTATWVLKPITKNV